MEYNSQKERLELPEYGRNIQQLVRYAQSIDDKEYRQAFIEKIVNLMYQMNPQSKNEEDYRIKLWKHVFQIAEFDLDVTPAIGDVPTPENSVKRPDVVPYPHEDTRFRHYGHNVQKLIKAAIEMEEGPVKEGFVKVIGSYMKLAYKTWNREHYVSDDLIREDLTLLSKGKLSIQSDASLDTLANPQRKRNKRVSSAPSNSPSNDRRNGGGKYRGRSHKRGK